MTPDEIKCNAESIGFFSDPTDPLGSMIRRIEKESTLPNGHPRIHLRRLSTAQHAYSVAIISGVPASVCVCFSDIDGDSLTVQELQRITDVQIDILEAITAHCALPKCVGENT